MANYQWYPGHMTKAKRMMQEDIKLIDLVIEVVDARIPLGSRNPDIDELGANKARIVLLNKSDLSDTRQNKLWMDYFTKQGIHALEINSKTGAGIKAIQGVVQEACKEKIERDRKAALTLNISGCVGVVIAYVLIKYMFSLKTLTYIICVVMLYTSYTFLRDAYKNKA